MQPRDFLKSISATAATAAIALPHLASTALPKMKITRNRAYGLASVSTM